MYAVGNSVPTAQKEAAVISNPAHYLHQPQAVQILSKIYCIQVGPIHPNFLCHGCSFCLRLPSFSSFQRLCECVSSRPTFCFRASLKNREMQHLLPVLREAGKQEHGPGNSYRPTSHCSSTKGAVSLGTAYLVANPAPQVRLLGARSLHVGVFLQGSVCKSITGRSLPFEGAAHHAYL